MRKSTKLAILVAALVALCSIAALAADTWKQEGDQWFCYDKDGNPYYGVWKKSGANWYYLDDATGAMVTNQLVETENDKYWCGEDGARVMNKWVQVPVDNDGDGWEWMYFKALSGKAVLGDGLSLLVKDPETNVLVKNPDKTFVPVKNAEGVSKKYLFDTDGIMKYGYIKGATESAESVLDAEYYFGSKDEGWQFTGWKKFVDGELADYNAEYAEKTLLYAYFKDGYKVANYTDPEDLDPPEYIRYKVATGKEYYFGDDGIMFFGYNQTDDDKWFYLGAADDGLLKKKLWVKTNEIAGSETEYWYYLDSEGNPTAAETGQGGQIFKVGGKYFLFDETGKMLTGVKAITTQDELDPASEKQVLDTSDEAKFSTVKKVKDFALAYGTVSGKGQRLFYFSTDADNDGSMKTGVQTITIDGEELTMYFDKHGVAYEGIVSNKIYNNGVLQAAGDQKFKVAKLNTAKDDDDAKYADKTYFPVNASGNILFNTKVVDADGVWWYVAASDATEDAGVIYKFCTKDYAAQAATAFKAGKAGFYIGKTAYVFVEPVEKEGFKYVDYVKGAWETPE